MVRDIFRTSPAYFQIQLQNDSFHSYVAGQTIIGRVVVELKDKLKIMALKIELMGKGAVEWEKEHYYVDNQNHQRWTCLKSYLNPLGAFSFYHPAHPEEETYIYQMKYLIGERVESPVTLPPGVHSFPFFFALSPWLPSSFEGRHCHIRYSLQATLERALFKDLKSESLKFDIKGILDLNTFPGISKPVNIAEHKSRDFLCWKLWSVSVTLDVDKTGFVPGEILKFSVKLNNSCSNVKLTRIKVYLIQKVVVKAPRAQCSYEHKVLKVDGPVIDAGAIETWEGQFEIPHVQPSGLGLYPAQVLRFNVQYFLKVTAKNVFTRIFRQAGLTIGTIPLRENAAAATGNSLVCNSQVILFGGGPHYTPYQNLAEVFPPLVLNNSNLVPVNSTGDNQNNNNSATQVDPIMDSSSENVENSQTTPAITTLNEQPRNEIAASITTLTDIAKIPFKRTDTPPPSYEEAIKKPSNKK